MAMGVQDTNARPLPQFASAGKTAPVTPGQGSKESCRCRQLEAEAHRSSKGVGRNGKRDPWG